MEKNHNFITVDDILTKLGAFGKFNLIRYPLILFPVLLTGFYASVYNFESMDLSYRCAVTECNDLPEHNWLNFTIPQTNGVYSKCERYLPTSDITTSNQTTCSIQNYDNTQSIKCDDYFYYENHSIVETFNLGCQDWKRTLVGTLHNAGFFISIPLTGIISDKFGRRFALTVSSLMNGLFGVLRALSVNYTMFTVFEFLEVAFGGGCYTACFVLAMEMCPPKGRVFVSLLINLMFITGGVGITLLAWWLKNWRHLLFVVYTPAIFVVLHLWLINESFRWLFSKGRNVEAITILKKAAQTNNVKITDEIYDSLIKQAKQERDVRKQHTIDVKKSAIHQIATSLMIWKRTSICSFLWITSTLVYYGLSINSIALSGNSYVNYIVVILIEAPANVMKLLLLDRFGRKRVISIAFCLSGCVCISYAFIPGYGLWPLVFFLGGKFFITLAYNSLYVFVAEVFPTNFRTTLIALCSTVGRIGSVMAPQTPLLSIIFEALPMILFGCMALMSGLLVLLLPETNNQKLPDNLQEAANLDNKMSSTQNEIEKK